MGCWGVRVKSLEFRVEREILLDYMFSHNNKRGMALAYSLNNNTMNEHFSFEKLLAYKSARKLVNEIYMLQKSFPREEKYALCDQIRRSSVSVAANIAEGSGRISAKEKLHFVEISYGSLLEAFCELQLASDLGYITQNALINISPKFEETAKLLSGLRTSLLKTINNSKNSKL